MAVRLTAQQSEHDAAVMAAKNIYEQYDKYVWVNPGSQRNKAWNGRYIDVIAADSATSDSAWVIEVETDNSVSESEAAGQWRDYDAVYTRWYLAVPVGKKQTAERLISKHDISHCQVVTWRKNQSGTHTFWGLPLTT